MTAEETRLADHVETLLLRITQLWNDENALTVALTQPENDDIREELTLHLEWAQVGRVATLADCRQYSCIVEAKAILSVGRD